MALELVPLCDVELTLKAPIAVGSGPSGMRLIIELADVKVAGERLKGQLKGTAAADWLAVVGTVGTLDVRFAMETDDGATVFVQYRGRTDVTKGPGSAPVYVTPTFETGDDRYAWLNGIQAAGKGTITGSDLHYEWYELR